MNKNNNIIGQSTASRCFYLPSPPLLNDSWSIHTDKAINHLIEMNGNHWRKILTIMAKISVSDTQWKHYREHQLLKRNECIIIGATQLVTGAKQHFICGQQSSELLQINNANFAPLKGAEGYLSQHSKSSIFLCPYLDYRQFPNLHIDNLRQVLGLPNLA